MSRFAVDCARTLVSALCLLLFSMIGSAAAADSVRGTFTVKGKTLVWKQVYVSRTSNPAEAGSKYLVVLVTDVPVAEADRRPARLRELATAGKLHAVRVTLKEGFDAVTATPYHGAIDDNGQATKGGAIIDLQAYNEKQLEAQIKSRPLGQEWHFNATLQAAVVPTTSTAEDFSDAVPVVAPTGIERSTEVEAGAPKDPTALKRALGRHGYEYTGEGFNRAVMDGNLDAVSLFLKLGMNPDTKAENGYQVLMSAVMGCTREPAGDRLGIVKALLGAKAAVDPKDMNGSTPLLWAVSGQCPTDFARVLVAAGANVNVKAKGGGTPLMLAKVFQQAELVALLQKAGAKE